jgi:hypothetical protein
MYKILVVFILSVALCANKAIQVDFLNAGAMDVYGKPLNNGYLYFYENDGGTTQKAVYADINKTTTLTQPIRTNSSGIPVVSGVRSAVFADGTYRVVIKNSDLATVLTLTGMQYNSAADLGGMYIDILNSYGDTTTALQNALNAYSGSTQNVTFLFKDGTYTVGSSMTFSTNITVKMLNGAKFSIDSGRTLTISGNLEANNQDIFDGLGTAVVSKVRNPIYYDGWNSSTSNIGSIQSITTINSIEYIGSISTINSIGKIGSISSITINTLANIKCIDFNIDENLVGGGTTVNCEGRSYVGIDGSTNPTVTSIIGGYASQLLIIYNYSTGTVNVSENATIRLGAATRA